MKFFKKVKNQSKMKEKSAPLEDKFLNQAHAHSLFSDAFHLQLAISPDILVAMNQTMNVAIIIFVLIVVFLWTVVLTSVTFVTFIRQLVFRFECYEFKTETYNKDDCIFPILNSFIIFQKIFQLIRSFMK